MLCAAVTVATLGVSTLVTAPQARAATATTAIETVVPTDFQTTWNALVTQLDEGDFTINATIKEQSTIRVLLQSKVPSQWVDCGSVSVDSKHKVFGDRNYKFLAANSVRYLVADDQFNELIDVERRTSLNALATIKLTPVRQGTRVSVDAQYVMKFRTREFGRKIVPRFLNDSLDFGSAGSATVSEEIREGSTMKVVSIGCQPTGALERQIVLVLERPAVLVAQNNAQPLPAKAAAPQPRVRPESRAQPKPRPVAVLAPPPVKATASKKLSAQFAAAAPKPRKQLSPPRSPNPAAPTRVATKPSSPSKAISPAKFAPATEIDTTWRIQLSALRSQSKAESALNLLQQATPDLLSQLTLRVQKVELSKGTFFRVQAGPLADRQASVSLCNRLKQKNQACLVVAP
ncbi:MAG: hypothetical protein HKN28_16525 [Alphaproteobacteria bacterium]|nr:hypothetical protein [Alphaproteobacteria bacterium]